MFFKGLRVALRRKKNLRLVLYRSLGISGNGRERAQSVYGLYARTEGA